MKTKALTRTPLVAAGSIATLGALAILAFSPMTAEANQCGMMKRPPPHWGMPMHQPIPYFARGAMPSAVKLGAMGKPGPSVVTVAKRSGDFGTLLTMVEAAGLVRSMSRKGNPYDNAFAESFMKTLKSEEVHLWEYRTMEDAQRRIPYFIEDVYNHKRLHSAIG